MLFVEQPPPQPPTTSVVSTEVRKPSGMCPIAGIALEKLRIAGKAQEGPGSEVLSRAWAFHIKFRGSWRPGAKKPFPEDIEKFDALKADLEKSKFPAWYNEFLQKAGQPQLISPVYDPTNPGFTIFKQTEETERIKALGIVYLTEHELDRKDAADKGARIISCLIGRTTLDYDLHSLYGRFLLDARVPTMAWLETRMGLYLNPSPNQNDLNFALFVGLITAKEQWPKIQEMIREVALSQNEAQAVIQEWAPRFQAQTKVVNTPVPK